MFWKDFNHKLLDENDDTLWCMPDRLHLEVAGLELWWAEVEPIFREEGLSLFPGGKLAPGKYDMTTRCSCPDYANPCKHTSAVLLLLGEEVARRPATLVELRGITMEELCDEI